MATTLPAIICADIDEDNRLVWHGRNRTLWNITHPASRFAVWNKAARCRFTGTQQRILAELSGIGKANLVFTRLTNTKHDIQLLALPLLAGGGG